MKIVSVVGARPNFMKIAPFIKVIDKYNAENSNSKVDHILVHTGQHYDDRMSKAFFKSLEIPDADINLEVGSGTHSEQVGQTMIKFEKVLISVKPDWVVVVGDVNATLACSITAKKEGVKVCHIEAGLRSGDMSMPEEINRIVTDRLSDLLLIPDRLSGENLKNEGISEEKIKFVGNIMIDTLEANREKAQLLSVDNIIEQNLITPLPPNVLTLSQPLAVVTLHRPSNVDKKEVLSPIVDFLSNEVTDDMLVIWPVHPRTLKKLQEFNLWNTISSNPNIILLYPLGYHEMLKLNMDAKVMLTDSGGLQSECSILGTLCLILRWNTEWIITLSQNGGNSNLVGNDISKLRIEYYKILNMVRQATRPELWDGKTASRCLNAILSAD